MMYGGFFSRYVTAGHDNKGFVIVWGNGSGYKFLTDCFSMAAELHKNEILYLPVSYRASEEFTDTFQGCEYN